MREFRADWDDPVEQNRLYQRPLNMQGRLDEWRAQPSGNNIPGFTFTRKDRALKGELVLQLV